MQFDERDVLLKAASIVEQGWTKDTLYRDKWGHAIIPMVDAAEDELVEAMDQGRIARTCALGAINVAVTEMGLTARTSTLAADRLLNHLDTVRDENENPLDLWSSVDEWNDNLPRSRKSGAHVAETMRQAAFNE